MIDKIVGTAAGALLDGRRIAGPAQAGEGFGAFIADALGSATRLLGDAEAKSGGAMLGGTPAHEAVQALMKADQALQAALAIRDKATSAIQEVSRMSI